jgi:1-acyl-sn-glycerol-3-phosphate acyltransferase
MPTRRQDRGRILTWYNRELGDHWGTSPSDYEPEAAQSTVERLRWVFGDRRYFRLQIEGWHNVPDAPAMIVSNHSGGTTIPDIWGFSFAWYRHFGVQRPLHFAAHDIILATAATRRFLGRRGVLRGSRAIARQVLSEFGRDLMVMPGGDLDTWRPYAERYRVRFGGRTGYARMALSTGVPIVPVAHAGAHETLIVLSDGRRLAKALRLDELARASIWPIHLSLPWGLAVGPWPHIPVPTRLRYHISEPIFPPADRVPDPPESMVQELDDRVRAAVQAGLDRLRDQRG